MSSGLFEIQSRFNRMSLFDSKVSVLLGVILLFLDILVIPWNNF